MNRRKFMVSVTCASAAFCLPIERRNIIVSESPRGYIHTEVLDRPVTDDEINLAIREFQEAYMQDAIAQFDHA